ncbi:LysR family transcriptional regulator [Acidisphaera sp. L21]|uniref:LysR family transcriptional regulator n=1 Tax=Acidisphaera sp. L21 TaxID=1641851 RepID=UPI00131D1ED2|nr:LysR family transcriptional regulator [Acidisphaera sp. L21]
MDLDMLRDFNLVAAHGGLGAASRAARRPKATLSRRLAELERQLGVRLIERGDKGLRLTDEGQRLYQQTNTLLVEVAEIAEEIASGAGTPRGILRVSAPVVLAHVALVAVALRYARAYPEVRLEMIAEDRQVDPVEDGYDVVLRIDPPADERLVGRRVMTDTRVVVAAPDMQVPASGAVRPVRGVVMATPGASTAWRVRGAGGGIMTFEAQPVLSFSSLLMVRDAVIGGAGVALLPKLLVAPDIAAGRLTEWGAAIGPEVEIWALHSTRRLASAKVRAFLALLEHQVPTPS